MVRSLSFDLVAQASENKMIQLLMDGGVHGLDVEARDGDGVSALQDRQVRHDIGDLMADFTRFCDQARKRTSRTEEPEDEFS